MLGLSILWCLGLAVGILADEVSSPGEDSRANTIAYFGPGDGEPAAVFRVQGEGLDSGVISVHLNDRFLYMLPLPRPAVAADDGVANEQEEDGVLIEITEKHVEQVLGRRLSDPDLPPVKVSVVLYNRITQGFVDVIDWTGYLQGCWLQFPEIAEAAGMNPHVEPFLKPTVDISSTFGEATPVDLRLERNTIYYMLFASQDRDALLLDPENPQLYARARVVGGGTFAWKDADDDADALETGLETGGSEGSEPAIELSRRNLRRLKYTPTSEKEYLVLWALHRSPVAISGGGNSVEADGSAGTEPGPSANGWTRSAVYELTNGPTGDDTDTAGTAPEGE